MRLTHSSKRTTIGHLIYICLITFFLLFQSTAFSDQATLTTAFELLDNDNFDKKAEGVTLLANSGDDRAIELLNAVLDGRLFIWKKDRSVVIGEKSGSNYQIRSALSGEALGEEKKRKLSKIGINNQIRSQIRSAIANLQLSNPNKEVRLSAVQSMIGSGDDETIDLLNNMLSKETDSEVRKAIETVVAVSLLDSRSEEKVLSAIEQVKSNLDPAIRGKLASLAESSSFSSVKKAAKRAAKEIEFEIELYGLVEKIFFGLSLGSVLVLAAIGLAITFGVMGVINMAHGELIMIGAYTTYVIQQLMPEYIGLSVLVAIPTAFIVSAIVGILIERGVIRFLYGRPLETLLATFGVSLVLQQAVRTIFSPLNRSVETPAWMSGALEINSVLSLTLNRMYIILFCLLVFAALFLILKKTPLGLQVRAVSQNRSMARAMGVRSEWVDAMTFGLGSGIAGVAGVALSQLTNVGPNLGQSYIIDSFMVVVFGGVGNLWGTLVGGLSLGVANKFLEPWSGAVLAKILVLVFIILFIQKRPRGLFPQKGRAAEG